MCSTASKEFIRKLLTKNIEQIYDIMINNLIYNFYFRKLSSA